MATSVIALAVNERKLKEFENWHSFYMGMQAYFDGLEHSQSETTADLGH